MKANSLKISMLAIVTMAAMSLTSFAQALGPVQDSPDGPWYMPGEVLIKFRTNVTDLQLQGVVQAVGIQSARHIHTPAMKASGNAGITHAFIARPVAQAIQALRNHPAVEYAEPNWVYTTHQYTSDDPLFVNGSLWGMYGDISIPANTYGSQAAEAWVGGNVGSRSVAVGIIDEGFQFTHPDLAANVWENPGETDNNIDDDENGYIDDIHGWDFYENNNTIYDGTGDDHGTHVSGTIGAVGGNNEGVAGINWAVTLISGKFLGPNGGTTDAAIKAVDYFTALKTRSLNPVNIVALNNSWGGGGYSQALHDAIIRAAKADILFVAASGNGNRAGKAINTDSTPVYPGCYNTAVGTSTESAADYDAVISVTAIDSSGNKASFANYGAITVDLGAPGVSINSTLPPDTYGAYSGTSMATPHVTGAVALYASVNPGATAFEIKDALLKAVKETPSLVGKTSTGGRLDLSTVIAPTTPPSPPAAPSELSAEGITYSQIRLTWVDASDNETRFEITRTADSGDPVTIVVAANLESYTDSNLDEKTTYTYTISACNSGGCTPATDPASATATTLSYAAPTVKWVGVDFTTKGDWINKYGSEGYDIVRYKQATAYGTVMPKDHNTLDPWAVTPDYRALQTPDALSRFFACYFKTGEFYLDINLDNNPHRVSIYCVDADRVNRVQEITVLDPSGSPLTATYTLTSFGEGQYLTWDITGHVLIKFKYMDSNYDNYNAVVSGIFFDEASYVPPTPAIPAAPSSLTAKAISSSAITLSWVDNATNEDGFEIQRSTSSSFTSPTIYATDPNERTFSDTGLSRLTTYYYRVRAKNETGYSAFSNTAYAKTKR